jgi:hypothetical protein
MGCAHEGLVPILSCRPAKTRIRSVLRQNCANGHVCGRRQLQNPRLRCLRKVSMCACLASYEISQERQPRHPICQGTLEIVPTLEIVSSFMRLVPFERVLSRCKQLTSRLIPTWTCTSDFRFLNIFPMCSSMLCRNFTQIRGLQRIIAFGRICLIS